MLNGRKHFVFSANYWQAMNLGVKDPAMKGNRERLMADLDDLKKRGVNNIRIMASSEGPDDSPSE
jgi:mannan endo-1,4-beta-mannosidase